MSKLSDIKNCHVCGGNNLKPLVNIPVSEILTDIEIIRTVLFCEDCETMHYIDEGSIAYEFSCTINEEIGRRVKR